MLHFVAFVYFVFTSTSHNRAHILQSYFFVSSLDWSVLKRSAACCSVLQRCHSPNWEICQFVTAISHAISVTQTNMNHVESSIYFSNRFKKKYIFKCMSMCLSTPRWVCECVDPWSHSFGVTAQECVRSKCDFSILGRVMFAGIYDIRLHPLLSVEETRRKALIPKHFTM